MASVVEAFTNTFRRHIGEARHTCTLCYPQTTDSLKVASCRTTQAGHYYLLDKNLGRPGRGVLIHNEESCGDEASYQQNCRKERVQRRIHGTAHVCEIERWEREDSRQDACEEDTGPRHGKSMPWKGFLAQAPRNSRRSHTSRNGYAVAITWHLKFLEKRSRKAANKGELVLVKGKRSWFWGVYLDKASQTRVSRRQSSRTIFLIQHHSSPLLRPVATNFRSPLW